MIELGSDVAEEGTVKLLTDWEGAETLVYLPGKDILKVLVGLGKENWEDFYPENKFTPPFRCVEC